MILFSSEIELDKNNKDKMTKLIIDAARDKIFLMIIDDDMNYNISHENSKINYERLILLIIEFLNSKNLDLIISDYITGDLEENELEARLATLKKHVDVLEDLLEMDDAQRRAAQGQGY